MDTILDTPIDEYSKFLQAHGTSAIRIAQLTLPAMLERGLGTFVTISSGSGYDFYPTRPPGSGGGSGLGTASARPPVIRWSGASGRVRGSGHPSLQC